VRMMAGAGGELCEGGTGTGVTEEVEGKVSKTGISFGNFVFLGLRRDSGMRSYGDADSYLCNEDGILS
jgi:hypothetical protein